MDVICAALKEFSIVNRMRSTVVPSNLPQFRKAGLYVNTNVTIRLEITSEL